MNDLPEHFPDREPLLLARISRIHRNVTAWWELAPDNLRGSVLLLLAHFAFGAMVALIKALGTSIPVPQLLVIRQIVMMLLLLPLFLPDLGGALRTNHMPLQILRGLCTLGSMGFGFTAIRHIPLADATALGFSQILFVTVLAVVVLKEKVGRHRWAATAIGFLGVLIMLRPGQNGFELFAFFAVLGALFGSGTAISVRILSRGERTATILLYQGLVLFAALIVPTVLNWVPPTPQQWLMLVLIGATGTAGQFLITRAFQTGEATALAPLDFTRLIINTAIGIVIFAELPDLVTVAGAALVVSSTIYVLHRNAKKGRPPERPTDPPA